GNNFPVEIILGAKKLIGKTASVSIYKNKVLKGTQRVNITSENFSSALNFTLSADAPGISRYNVTLSLEENEMSKVQDNRFFILDVINHKEKVLLLANAPHPDVNAIRD